MKSGMKEENFNVGSLQIDSFQLGASATANHVLTTDTQGIGTWQASQGGGQIYQEYYL